MRPAPKMSLLMADTAAVITTILSRVAAELMPRLLKICTNGLPWLADLRPRVDGHQYKQGQHVEQQDAQRYRVDRFGDHTFRVFGLTGRDADDLNAAEGEHHHRKRGNHAAHAIGHKATVLPQVAEAGGGCVCTRMPNSMMPNPPDDHRDDCGDLEQRQPELHFAEHFDAAQVQRRRSADDAEYPDPAGNVGEPEPHVDAEGGDVRQATMIISKA
jgi:hypothetical protein